MIDFTDIINNISVLSPVRKEFYCQILDMRKEKIFLEYMYLKNFSYYIVF